MQLVHANATAFYLERQLAEGRGRRPALREGERTWSYGELLAQTRRAGAMLLHAGATRGERVLVLLPDTLEAAAIVFGAMHVGAVPAPVHTRLSEQELALVCGDARPRVAVTTADRVATLLAIRARTGWPQTVVAFGGEQRVCRDQAIRATDAMAAIDPAELAENAPCGPDDVALLQYTSGSTGRPKGSAGVSRWSRTTSATRPPSCRSATASATRCCSRSRRARARCCAPSRPSR
jgi:4-hydroxybenzoate-CoA ligase